MSPTLALAALLAAQPGDDVAPILFDTITPKAAAALHGQRVAITFTPALPAYTFGKGKRLTTVAGPLDVDDVGRSVPEGQSAARHGPELGTTDGPRPLARDPSHGRGDQRGSVRGVH